MLLQLVASKARIVSVCSIKHREVRIKVCMGRIGFKYAWGQMCTKYVHEDMGGTREWAFMQHSNMCQGSACAVCWHTVAGKRQARNQRMIGLILQVAHLCAVTSVCSSTQMYVIRGHGGGSCRIQAIAFCSIAS